MISSPMTCGIDKTFDQSGSAAHNDDAELNGAAIDKLSTLDAISIRTANSEYRLLLLDPQTGRVLIQGGSCFAEPAEVMVMGSTFGNSVVNNKWIGVGRKLEIWFDDKFIVTSPVRDIRVEPHSSQVDQDFQI